MFSSNSKQKAIERFGNPVRINKNGNELVFKCIKCGREKLYYNVQTAIYHCFRCDYSGKLRVRVSMSDLRNRYNMDGLKKVTNIKPPEMILIPYIQKPLTDAQITALHNRGLTDSDILFYHISGREEDGRIQIPNYIKGTFTDLVCNWEWDKSKITDENPKYLNSEGTLKGETLFNIFNIPDEAEQIILCEGIFNAITAGRNAIASYGCLITQHQIDLLLSKKPKSILIAYDSDEPGVKGSIKVIKMLREAKYSGVVEYVLLPKGIDINDLGRDNFKNYYSSNKIIIDLDSPISIKLPKLMFDSRV